MSEMSGNHPLNRLSATDLARATLIADGQSTVTSPVNRPRVGVSLLVLRDDHVLLGRRRGSHGAGEYATPGGHQELGEAHPETALRELAEECGSELLVSEPEFLCVTDLRTYVQSDGRHYTDVGFVSHWLKGTPRLMEPEKCEGWSWHHVSAMPRELFPVVPNLLLAHRTSQRYFGD